MNMTQVTTMKGYILNGWMDSDIKKADEAERYVNKLLLNLAVSDFPEVESVKGAIRMAVAMEFFSLEQGVLLANQADELARGRREQLRTEAHKRHQARAK